MTKMDKWFITGDQDGRILLWDRASGLATRPVDFYKHKIQCIALTSNQDYVFSASADLTLM